MDAAVTVNRLIDALKNASMQIGADPARVAEIMGGLAVSLPPETAGDDETGSDGDERRAEVDERLEKAEADIARVVPAVAEEKDPYPDMIEPHRPHTFLARIDQEDAGGGGEYDQWTEMWVDDDGVLKVKADGLDETSTGRSIWETNDGEGVAVNTVVRVHEVRGDELQYNFERQVLSDAIPIGTVVGWALSVGSIPSGWALCDGANHNGTTTINLKGKFVVGYAASGGMDGYDTPGSTGGNNLHGYDQNNHNDHDLDHVHAATRNSEAGAAVPANESASSPSWMGGCGGLKPSGTHLASHGGWMDADGTDPSAVADTQYTDNRPAYYVLVFIQKIA